MFVAMKIMGDVRRTCNCWHITGIREQQKTAPILRVEYFNDPLWVFIKNVTRAL